MKLKFKINLKDSRIPEFIKVPKTLIEGRLLKGKEDECGAYVWMNKI